MGLITLVSAAGSPGTSTCALGLALTWPRPVVLVEADPAGSSALLAGFFQGQLDHPGLADLVMAHRRGVLAETVRRIVLPLDGTDVSVLVGSKSHQQAGLLQGLWPALLGVLREIATAGQDVIADAGRLGLTGSPTALVSQSDVAVLVTRTTLPSLVAARSWASALAEDVVPGHAARLLLVGPGRPYGAAEVSKTLGLPVAGAIAWDPAGAAVLSEGADKPRTRFGGANGAERAFAHSAFMTSLDAAGQSLRKAFDDSVSRDRSAVFVAARALVGGSRD